MSKPSYIMSGMEKWKHLKIPFSDIKNATKDFTHEIGRGGYGRVYEGMLLINGKYTKVAVKRLNENLGQGLKEFLTEIDLLSGIQHQNLISLVGYCDEGNEKIIAYEFAERGSLDVYFRFKNAKYTLTWMDRLKIVVDAARGLDHLHNHLQNKQVIIHRDIKSSNILLDVDWVAKVSDFGLSKSTFAGLDRSMIISHVCGTPGYVEPELCQTSIATKKTDVYSFGMVLFEVLCGKLCNVSYEDGIILSAGVVKYYQDNDELEKIIDPTIREQMSVESLRKFSEIAINCLNHREKRPTIDVVKKELEETLKIQAIHSAPTNRMRGRPINLFRIPLVEIKSATTDFTKFIEQGEYGFVYGGELPIHGIYMKVRVKRLRKEFGQGIWGFLNEIQMLLAAQHENLITLVGYCDEENEKIIVYKYEELASLDMYIRCSNTNSVLTWLERLKIVVDVARGLAHLYDHAGKHLIKIKNDMKSSNILLDDKLVPKFSTIGITFSTYRSNDINSLPNRANDKDMSLNVSMAFKQDVYSFGMVLFEVLCGRLCSIKEKDGISLTTKLARKYYAKGKLEKIIDPILREQMNPDSLRKFSAIAYECLHSPEEQPMIDVVKKELEEALQIEVLRWGKFISRHWSIINVDEFSPINVVMQHEETRRLKSVVSSDEDEEYGMKGLENRYQFYIQRSDEPLRYINKQELYLHLYEGFLYDNGRLWFSLCELSYGIRLMLSSKVLSDDVRHGRLDVVPLHESRFREVIILGHASSYSFTCTFESRLFSYTHHMYACYLVFKFEDRNKHHNDNYLFTAEYTWTHKPIIDGLDMRDPVTQLDLDRWIQHRTSVDEPIIKAFDMNEDDIEYDSDSWMQSNDDETPTRLDISESQMEQRKDGWVEVRLIYPLFIKEGFSKIMVRLSALEGSFRGVIVEGIEFRPYVS